MARPINHKAERVWCSPFPSFLYDYVGVIWAKHDIDDSDQLISTGADRRQTPMGHRTKRILRIERKEYQTY